MTIIINIFKLLSYSNEKLKPFIEVYYLALFFRRLDYKLALFL